MFLMKCSLGILSIFFWAGYALEEIDKFVLTKSCRQERKFAIDIFIEINKINIDEVTLWKVSGTTLSKWSKLTANPAMNGLSWIG